MRVIQIAQIILSISFLGACSTAESSLNYTRGTDALKEHDYESAIQHLEEAVRLDPEMSRNYNNLAAAYFGAGRVMDGFLYVRRALELDSGNRYARANFDRIWTTVAEAVKIEIGVSMESVVENLGVPDADSTEDGAEYLLYGTRILKFENGRLTQLGEISI